MKKKKISKFKKWLIYKLGGFTMEDMINTPIYSVTNIKLVPIVSKIEINNMAALSFEHEEFLKRRIKQGFLEHIQPVYTFEKDDRRCKYVLKATIELPSEYAIQEEGK